MPLKSWAALRHLWKKTVPCTQHNPLVCALQRRVHSLVVQIPEISQKTARNAARETTLIESVQEMFQHTRRSKRNSTSQPDEVHNWKDCTTHSTQIRQEQGEIRQEQKGIEHEQIFPASTKPDPNYLHTLPLTDIYPSARGNVVPCKEYKIPRIPISIRYVRSVLSSLPYQSIPSFQKISIICGDSTTPYRQLPSPCIVSFVFLIRTIFMIGTFRTNNSHVRCSCHCLWP